MKTYTFVVGTICPGFTLADTEEHEKALFLGEAGTGSWLARIPLNRNPENRPVVENNIVHDAFLFNVAGGRDDRRPLFILSRDCSQHNGCCLIRFRTECEGGRGNGYVDRVTGFRSKRLAGGHGRNSGITPTNGTWSDEVWVVHERELLRVQLAGCESAFAVRVRNGEPTVEPWVEREPRQEPIAVSGNGNNGKHQWRTLRGSHVSPEPAWSPGVGELLDPNQELADIAELEEMARAAGGKRAGTKTCRPGQPVAA